MANKKPRSCECKDEGFSCSALAGSRANTSYCLFFLVFFQTCPFVHPAWHCRRHNQDIGIAQRFGSYRGARQRDMKIINHLFRGQPNQIAVQRIAQRHNPTSNRSADNFIPRGQNNLAKGTVQHILTVFDYARALQAVIFIKAFPAISLAGISGGKNHDIGEIERHGIEDIGHHKLVCDLVVGGYEQISFDIDLRCLGRQYGGRFWLFASHARTA